METKCQLAKVSILGAVPADLGHVVGIAMIDSTYQSKYQILFWSLLKFSLIVIIVNLRKRFSKIICTRIPS